jgi:hypothetical protein
MKVYSLYYKEEFVAAFSNRGWAVDYGKLHYPDSAWDCNIVEEYLSKSPPHYTSLHSLTPQQTTPCNPGITLMPGTPQINNSVRAETNA